MSEIRKIVDLKLAALAEHPLNRVFDRDGGEWAEFVRSVELHGVLQPLVVRPLDAGWQIIAGHRRAAAAAECGLDVVPCSVRELSDKDALEFLLLENLQRSDLDPVDEAELVRAMLEMGSTAEDVAKRISRSVEWVTIRQGVLDLGDEVREALKLPRGERGHLTIGSAAVLLGVPAEERCRAAQLVLHPDWQDEPLGARDAEATVRKLVLEPLRRREAWEKGGAALKKAWRKNLEENLPKEQRADLAVILGGWDEGPGGYDVGVMERLPEPVTEACRGRLWLDLAVRHGLAVRILPGGEGGCPVVDMRLLRQAEEARAESGMETWLLVEKKADAGGRKSEVERAEALLNGDGEPNYDTAEPLSPVATSGNDDGVKIEQTFKHSAVIDMGAVRKLHAWAASADADPSNAPDYVPQWATEAAYEGNWSRIDAVCLWVMGLKG